MGLLSLWADKGTCLICTHSLSSFCSLGRNISMIFTRLPTVKYPSSMRCCWLLIVCCKVPLGWGIKVFILRAAFWTSVISSAHKEAHEWQILQAGNVASYPGEHSSQRIPDMPDPQIHSPVSGSHDGRSVPSRWQSQAEKQEREISWRN